MWTMMTHPLAIGTMGAVLSMVLGVDAVLTIAVDLADLPGLHSVLEC